MIATRIAHELLRGFNFAGLSDMPTDNGDGGETNINDATTVLNNLICSITFMRVIEVTFVGSRRISFLKGE